MSRMALGFSKAPIKLIPVAHSLVGEVARAWCYIWCPGL